MDVAAIPHPPDRVPLLGDIRGARRSTPLQNSMQLSRQLGPIFRRKFLRTEIVLVSGADLVAELSDESRFGKHVGLGIEHLRGIAGDGLFTAHSSEPNWRLAHDILQPAFSQDAMRRYHPIMLATARELAALWDSTVDDRPVDVAADMTKLTLETIGRAGFGYEFGSFQREQPHPFVTAMVRALRYAQQQNFRLPLIGRFQRRKADRQNAADVAYMSELVDDVIRARRASGETGGEDLLARMLEQKHPDTGQELDPLNIRYQVLTFLVAGHETTSGALSFALYYLTNNPGALARAQAEVDAMWGDQDDPDPSFKDVGKLRYVRQVLDESLRLWPTAPAYSREARSDEMLGGRYRMRAGDWVVVLLPMLHRDPAVWGPDPDRFDPDRFAPGRARQRPAHTYKPFGTGERACIGRQFAIHEAMLVLALLLHRYDFQPDQDYRLRVKELLTLKPDGFTLRVRRRRTRSAAQALPELDNEPAAQCPSPGSFSAVDDGPTSVP